MKIKSITLQKSKTLGVISQDGRTKFKKLQIQASADLDENDMPADAYMELSKYIEAMLVYEAGLNK